MTFLSWTSERTNFVKEEKIDPTSKIALSSFLRSLLRTQWCLRNHRIRTNIKEKIITNIKAKTTANRCNKSNNIIWVNTMQLFFNSFINRTLIIIIMGMVVASITHKTSNRNHGVVVVADIIITVIILDKESKAIQLRLWRRIQLLWRIDFVSWQSKTKKKEIE